MESEVSEVGEGRSVATDGISVAAGGISVPLIGTDELGAS
jgi:hypothetical protein